MTTFADWSDLPEPARRNLAVLEEFIGDVDGKTLATPTGDNYFTDDGTVDANAAVVAINELVALIRSGATAR